MRKNSLFSLLALGVASLLPAAAQLPDVSTAQQPKWYFIQVLGSDTRVDRVFTLEADDYKVAGEAMTTSVSDDVVGRQLWRFEQNDAGRYVITNKASGRQLDVAYDSDEGTARAVCTAQSSQTFQLNALGDYFQIELEKAVTSGENWLHQGNSGYDFAVITVGTTWSSGDNSKFHFVEYVDPAIDLSDSERTTYYTISNCAYAARAVRETVDADGAGGSLTLDTIVDGDTYAQWYAEGVGSDGVRWINRATGHALNASSAPYGLFNLLSAGTVVATADAWTATHIGEGQYTFSVKEDDGIVRYMGADIATADEAVRPDTTKFAATPFAWRLTRVETIATGISTVDPSAKPAFSVDQRAIVGEGLRIYTIGGQTVAAGRPLQPGVYLVTAGGMTTKVLIK